MELRLTSVMVDNQDKALAFYVDKLGFVKSKDIPMGQFRWLTVTAPEGAEGVELLLEPMGFPPAVTFQRELFEAGIPATLFISKDVAKEYELLKARGVRFRGEPTRMGGVTVVLFEDTCGNLINLVQPES